MARILKASDINAEMSGEVLSGLSGIISKVFKHRVVKAKNPKWGDSNVQDIYIKHAGVELKVSIWNHEEIPQAYIGKEVVFERQSKKGGDLTVKAGVWNNKATLDVSVGKNAIFQVVGAEPHSEEGSESQEPSEERWEGKETPEPSKPVKTAPTHDLGHSEDALNERKAIIRQVQLANLYEINFKAASAVAVRHGFDVGQTKELATAFFIQMLRENQQDLMAKTARHVSSGSVTTSEPPQAPPEPDPSIQPDAPSDAEPMAEPVLDWKCHVVKVKGHQHESKVLGELRDEVLQSVYATFRPQPVNGNYNIEEVRLANALITWNHEYRLNQENLNKPTKTKKAK